MVDSTADMAATAPAGRPLQIITLNLKEKKVEVNEDELGRLEKALRATSCEQIAIISVMGAFRTGKSFMLDLFLRFLRSGEGALEGTKVPRGSVEDTELPIPSWLGATEKLEGADGESGFRFKGGMDVCTEGIWVWSEPFVRKIDGQDVALLLMDTQGAWDSGMSKEQSASIFGLTAVLSSKQIYNVTSQIQEDKVENLTYFMEFARAALRQAALDNKSKSEEVQKPFQMLDFLVRDWKNFHDEWTVEQCKEQMAEHLARHCDPSKVVENSSAEALESMFANIGCFCLPHPGFQIEKAKWTGEVKDISRDFLNLADDYIRDVFASGIVAKKIMGSSLSPHSFGPILRNFVEAFHDAAPQAMTFTQAITNSTVLLAKEAADKSYSAKMEDEAKKNPRGSDPDTFLATHTAIKKMVKEEYNNHTIFGNDEVVASTWKDIDDNLQLVLKRFSEDNARRLEKALVSLANIALAATFLFLLDRLSDWVCDWWSTTCVEASRAFLMLYAVLFAFIAYHVVVLYKERGQLACLMAGGELWKEMVRLIGAYYALGKEGKFAELGREVSGGYLDNLIPLASASDAAPAVAKTNAKKND